jgi:hypothetical protein
VRQTAQLFEKNAEKIVQLLHHQRAVIHFSLLVQLLFLGVEPRPTSRMFSMTAAAYRPAR